MTRAEYEARTAAYGRYCAEEARKAARALPAARAARAKAAAERQAAAQAKARELRAAGVRNGGRGPRSRAR